MLLSRFDEYDGVQGGTVVGSPLMGTMTFLLPAGITGNAARELERACVAGGADNMPWPTRVQVEGNRLTVQRDVDESGYLSIPWEINGAGRLMGTTATLMERLDPYQLQVELARGKVNQVRNQASEWQAGGLPIPGNLDDLIRETNRAFSLAATEANDQADNPHAREALVHSYKAAEQLTQVYIDQVFRVRHQRDLQLNTALGCRLAGLPSTTTAPVLAESLNSVALPFNWSQIEPNQGGFCWDTTDAILDWAESQGLSVTGGPLIDFAAAHLPDWLWLWERDPNSLAKFMANYVTTALKRYRRRIRRWQLTGASNCASILSLGEEELLWITVKLAQVARQLDSALELVVGIAQPWGEYMALDDRTQSPFFFADTLIRSDLNLAAIDIELVMGVSPRGSYCRDLLETSRLLDMYAILGVPLRITLGYPAAASSDSKADPELRVQAGRWRGEFSAAVQADWASAFASLAVCKPQVQAVHWVHWSDADSHLFPHCGLLDARGEPRAALSKLRNLRQQHLR